MPIAPGDLHSSVSESRSRSDAKDKILQQPHGEIGVVSIELIYKYRDEDKVVLKVRPLTFLGAASRVRSRSILQKARNEPRSRDDLHP